MTPLHPTSDAQRIDALDAMRGVAVLGVLVAYTVWSLGNPPEETWSAADRGVAHLIDLLVDGKFLAMFAFLFGVGVAQQWRRWEAAGQDPAPLHLRRMGFLLGVGLIHGALLRNGDILAPYALLGLVLPGFQRASTRTLSVAAIFLASVPHVVKAIAAAYGLVWPSRPGAVEGGYLIENLTWLRYWYQVNPLLGWPTILALMMVGLAVGRAQGIERLASSRAGALRLLAIALPIAVLLRLALEALASRPAFPAPDMPLAITRHVLYEAGAWALAATYCGAILLLSQRPATSALLAPLRTIGRMAFTNYLTQAAVIVPLCLAFGWFDRVSPARGVALALGLALVQFGFCTWWLARHRMGPFERLWRGVTYGFRQVPA